MGGLLIGSRPHSIQILRSVPVTWQVLLDGTE
jgi:hypothetical protein